MATNSELTDGASEENFYDKSLNIWIGEKLNEDRIKVGHEFQLHPLDLHTECSIGHYECVRRLIGSRETSLDMKNRGGWTPLMYACYTGHENVVILLLEAGVSVNLINDKQATPLMLAASCGNDGIARCLLEQHAFIDAVDCKGWTALYHATFSGHQNVVKLLLDRGANANISEPVNGMTPLMEAASAGHEVIVQYFLNQGIHFKAINKHGHSALAMAMLKGHSKIVSLIKEHAKRLENANMTRSADHVVNQSQNKIPSIIMEGPEVIQELMKKKLIIQGSQAPIQPSHSTWTAAPQTTSAHSGNHVSPQISTNQHSSYNIQQKVSSPQSNFPMPSNYPSMNLHQLLVELGLAKYSPIFEEQDVDLAVFLTLTDNDLKEIGVNLLGPRKKMMMAINRWHGGASPVSTYRSSCSPLPQEGEFQEIILNLHQRNQHLEQHLQREEQLRATLESCLMRDRMELHEFVDRLIQHFNRFSARKDVLIANLGECIKEFECSISKQSTGVSAGQGDTKIHHCYLQNVNKLRCCFLDMEALLNAICNDTHSLIVNAQNRS